MPGDAFAAVCERIGGFVVEGPETRRCVVYATPDSLLEIVGRAREMLGAAPRGKPHMLEVRMPVIGDTELVVIEAVPGGGYRLYAKVFTDYTVHGELKPVRPLEKTFTIDGVRVAAKAYADTNPAIEGYYGVAEAWAESSSLEKLTSVLGELLYKLKNMAEEALEKQVERAQPIPA